MWKNWARGWDLWALPLVYFVAGTGALRLRTLPGTLHPQGLRHVTCLVVRLQPPRSERWLHPLLL